MLRVLRFIAAPFGNSNSIALVDGDKSYQLYAPARLKHLFTWDMREVQAMEVLSVLENPPKRLNLPPENMHAFSALRGFANLREYLDSLVEGSLSDDDMILAARLMDGRSLWISGGRYNLVYGPSVWER